jgi:hypothetical protein
MTEFNELSGLERYGEGAVSGDIAENAVMDWFKNNKYEILHYGPKHVPTGAYLAGSWTKEVRYTPDFLARGTLVEVQGCRDTRMIVKCEKLEVLFNHWNKVMRTVFAFYIISDNLIVFADVETVWNLVHSHPGVEVITLDENTKAEKQAWSIPLGLLYGLPRVQSILYRKGW